MEITIELIENICYALVFCGLGTVGLLRIHQGELLYGLLLIGVVLIAIGLGLAHL